ncbi:hypothetical protein [Pontimicrobium aquaticum]|uniref:Erythromycin esterase homolog n=1 Tax=Pontimicrobium aquaticum TaxID=2565367 RepID=A0A4U0F2Y6_9FLAO|nr:hypothetical protein [Pontimicrobium aquaticum]TJY37082.1 hypothetical protein E5167_03810 [Pontimicrobium aquaticum]
MDLGILRYKIRMNTLSYLKIAAQCFCCYFSIAYTFGQTSHSVLNSLIHANSYELTLDSNGDLGGNGFNFIKEKTQSVQFVNLGEQHQNKEIPIIATSIFKYLNKLKGFNYVALEQDPLIARLSSQEPYKGDRKRIYELAKKYLHGFTFYSDQDLNLVADVGSLSKGKGNAIWGADPTIGMSHYLDELLKLKPSKEAENILIQLKNKANLYENKRGRNFESFMSGKENVDINKKTLEKLKQSYRLTEGSYTNFLINNLIVGNRVKWNYHFKNHYMHSYEREEFMKSRFIQEYNTAYKLDNKLPKVMTKFGIYHSYSGMSENNVLTFGNFLHEFAKSNGMDSFTLAMYVNSDKNGYSRLEKWAPYMVPFINSVSKEKIVIIDVLPLREYYVKGTLSNDLKKLGLNNRDILNFKRHLFGVDAILLIGNGTLATSFQTGIKIE